MKCFCVHFRYFTFQLEAAADLKLPLFLHCRNAAKELVDILSRFDGRLVGGVVHSFDGSEDDAKAILKLGYYIGINGWYKLSPLIMCLHLLMCFIYLQLLEDGGQPVRGQDDPV